MAASNLPAISPEKHTSPTPPKLKLARLSLVANDASSGHEYSVSPRHLPGNYGGAKDVHSPKVGILSPTRKSRRGTVDQFSKFLKSFNEQRERTASMLDNYHESRASDGGATAENADGVADSSNSSRSTAVDGVAGSSVTGSPTVSAKYRALRHTITAASALQSHLQQAIKPRKYTPEARLTPAQAKVRRRLAVRLQAIGFPLDPSLQALKQTGNKVGRATDLLLKWYPKGSGGRNMVKRMIGVIEASENKLQKAHDKIRSVMSNGSLEDRLGTVIKFFSDSDDRNKGFLTPVEFSHLSSRLGIDLSNAELREAIVTLDEDGNGQVELSEYLDWWGDEDLAALHAANQGDDSHTKRPSRRAKLKPINTRLKRHSRTSNMSSPTFLGSSPRSDTNPLAKFGKKGTSAAVAAGGASGAGRITSEEYLQKSMAFLNRQAARKSARTNISAQIGMYDNIRAGGGFDHHGNMLRPDPNVKASKIPDAKAHTATSSALSKAGSTAGSAAAVGHRHPALSKKSFANQAWATKHNRNSSGESRADGSPKTRERRRQNAEKFARDLKTEIEKGRQLMAQVVNG